MANFRPFDTQKYLRWPEAVTVTSARKAGDVAKAGVSAGVYYGTAKEAAPSYGVYVEADIVVTVASDVLGWEPKPRDRVTWKGADYTVLTVAGSDWLKFRVLGCRNLSLAHDLKDVGTLYRQGATTDAAGILNSVPPAVESNVDCRVQPTDATAADVMGRRTAPRKYTTYVGRDVRARAKDVFEVGGRRYTVTGYHDPERLDALPRMDLEEVL